MFIIAIAFGIVAGFFLGMLLKKELGSSDMVEARTLYLAYMKSLTQVSEQYLEKARNCVNSSRLITENVRLF